MSARSAWVAGAAGALLGVTGCAQAPATLYHWGPYQAQLYEHFKADGSGAEAQLRVLTEHADKAAAGGRTLPPGFYGHLGLLHLRLGSVDQARALFRLERERFPESAPYMSFLLKDGPHGPAGALAPAAAAEPALTTRAAPPSGSASGVAR